MVRVDMSVTKAVDKLAPSKPTDLGEHAGQQRVTRNIEGYAKAHITGALVHLTGESLVSSDVELSKDVARR